MDPREPGRPIEISLLRADRVAARPDACHNLVANERNKRIGDRMLPEPNLELLMQMVQRVLDGQQDIREDVREIKTRLGRMATDVA